MLPVMFSRKTITAAFENPTYPRAWKIFQLFAGEVVTVSSDASGICIEELEKSGAQVVYAMPSHQYPTGRKDADRAQDRAFKLGSTGKGTLYYRR